MKRFLLRPNPDKDCGLAGTKAAAAFLMERGAQLFMEEEYRAYQEIAGVQYCPFGQAERQAECVLVFGGDGTLLQTAHQTELPLLGMNFGHLGFITELKKGETELFSRLLEDDYRIDRRMMLSCVRVRGEERTKPFYALNDIVISRGGGPHMIRLNLQIDGDYAETYLADGLVVSTPTGSTAYALSAGGTILEPDVEAVEITPICPHMLRARPLVVSSKRTVSLLPVENSMLHVSADGVQLYEAGEGDRLEICRAEKETKLIRLQSRSFYDILHEKLGSDKS